MSAASEEPEIRIQKPLPVDRESKRGPSLVLSTIFALGMTAIVVPLVGFVVSVTMAWQGGLTFFTQMLKWSFIAIGAVLAYGMLVGLYHTILAVTGLDGGNGPRQG